MHSTALKCTTVMQQIVRMLDIRRSLTCQQRGHPERQQYEAHLVGAYSCLSGPTLQHIVICWLYYSFRQQLHLSGLGIADGA
jgi:hypothetical protein